MWMRRSTPFRPSLHAADGCDSPTTRSTRRRTLWILRRDRDDDGRHNTTTSAQPQARAPGELRIVVGVDGSPCSLKALEYAGDQAALTGSILQVVTVFNGLPGYGFTAGIDQEGALSIVRDALDVVEKKHPTALTKGETVYGVPGPVLADISDGASALSWSGPEDTDRSSAPSSGQSRNTCFIMRTASPRLFVELTASSSSSRPTLFPRSIALIQIDP